MKCCDWQWTSTMVSHLKPSSTRFSQRNSQGFHQRDKKIVYLQVLAFAMFCSWVYADGYSPKGPVCASFDLQGSCQRALSMGNLTHWFVTQPPADSFRHTYTHRQTSFIYKIINRIRHFSWSISKFWIVWRNVSLPKMFMVRFPQSCCLEHLLLSHSQFQMINYTWEPHFPYKAVFFLKSNITRHSTHWFPEGQ